MPGTGRVELLEALRRRRAAIRLGGESMRDVISAAEALRAWPATFDGDHDLARVRTVLENGMFVTYARPFTPSALGTLSPAATLTVEQRSLHDEILELRNSVYAHTDHTPWREALDNPGGDDVFFVSTLYPTRVGLDEIIGLAKAQLAGFLSSLDKLDRRLAAESSTDALTQR